jgi:predicted nucleotidyltransferase
MLDSSKIELIKARLIQTYQPREIYLFGSYAWGKPDNDSDIDLLVILNESNEKSYKRPIKGIKALKGLKIGKDIIVYTKSEFHELSGNISTLCYKIKNEGLKIYEAP